MMGKATGQKKLARQDVVARVVAAALGGYVLTYAATACLALLLPLPKTEAVLTATMLSFIIYTSAILWAFAASTPIKAWLGLVVPAIICAAIALPLGWADGG
jgi:hypothetical protein